MIPPLRSISSIILLGMICSKHSGRVGLCLQMIRFGITFGKRIQRFHVESKMPASLKCVWSCWKRSISNGCSDVRCILYTTCRPTFLHCSHSVIRPRMHFMSAKRSKTSVWYKTCTINCARKSWKRLAAKLFSPTHRTACNQMFKYFQHVRAVLVFMSHVLLQKRKSWQIDSDFQLHM